MNLAVRVGRNQLQVVGNGSSWFEEKSQTSISSEES